uniref:Uncharacterized protein n=1 Tax=Candidatus Kentrum sp. LFY TaxID=2126342 RepID=A0A450V3I7_9GAMM|nr:MAG: hypothetical protein BECKLFY1418A_GA0070994_109722 [Candidatus Kentron sp. LFY]
MDFQKRIGERGLASNRQSMIGAGKAKSVLCKTSFICEAEQEINKIIDSGPSRFPKLTFRVAMVDKMTEGRHFMLGDGMSGR